MDVPSIGSNTREPLKDLAYRLDICGCHITANPSLVRLLGYDTVEAFLSNSEFRYVAIGRREQLLHALQINGSVSHFISEVYRSDHSTIWIEEQVSAIYDEFGFLVHYEGRLRDVTFNKLHQIALERDEKRFRALAEGVDALPWQAHLDTWQFEYVGPQAEPLLGFTRQEWLQDGFWQSRIHPQDRGWVSTVRAEAIENRGSFECEYRVVRKDARIIFLREMAKVHSLGNDSPVLTGFFFDVTYRQFTEAALRDNPHSVEHIVNAAPSILYAYDISSKQCLLVLGATETLIGYSREALWNMQPLFYLALAHEAEQAQHAQHLADLETLKRGSRTEREFRVRAAKGHWVWLRSQESLYSVSEEKLPEKIVGIAVDVTAQHIAMEELANSENLFRSLAETTRIIPFEMDLETGQFTYVGPQAESLLGYPVQHWFKRSGFLSLVHSDDREAATQFMYPPSSHPGPDADYEAEFRLCGADGQIRWVRELIRYARGEDQRLRARGFLFDITEAKTHEEELRQARDQLRALALRNQNVREDERTHVAQEIHDELGQALTLFRIDLGWLENRLNRFAPTRALDPIDEKITSMKKMVDGTLRTVRRIISNLRPAVLDELGLRAAIEWQASEFSRRVGIRCNVQADAVDGIDSATSVAIFRIFQEILTNVLRHAQASRVDVKLLLEETSLSLSVSDNGRGFSPSAPTLGKSFGLLGMRERAQALGGILEIVSNVGTGTKVTVRLPALRRDAPEATS